MSDINEKIVSTFKNSLGGEDISTILVYGSQATGLFNSNSDIDVIVITNGKNELLGKTTIDGKTIEYHVIPMEDVYSLSVEEIVMSSNRSWCSILNNCDIIYETEDTIFLRDLIDKIKPYFSKKSKKRNSRASKSSKMIALEWYYYYKDHSTNPNNLFSTFIYYNLIDAIRRFDFDFNNFDNIPVFKLFRIMSNPEQRDNYCIDRFPNDEYMSKLQTAMDTEDIDSLFIRKFFESNLVKDDFMQEKVKKQNINYQLIVIGNAIERVKQARDTSYYLYYYYILLEKIRYLYTQINGMISSISEYDFCEPTTFNAAFIGCLKKLNIESLEELFGVLREGYDIDLNNYCIRIYK